MTVEPRAKCTVLWHIPLATRLSVPAQLFMGLHCTLQITKQWQVKTKVFLWRIGWFFLNLSSFLQLRMAERQKWNLALLKLLYSFQMIQVKPCGHKIIPCDHKLKLPLTAQNYMNRKKRWSIMGHENIFTYSFANQPWSSASPQSGSTIVLL